MFFSSDPSNIMKFECKKDSIKLSTKKRTKTIHTRGRNESVDNDDIQNKVFLSSLNFDHDATRIRVYIKAYNIIIQCDGVIEIGARVSDHFHFHCDVAGNSIELGFW